MRNGTLEARPDGKSLSDMRKEGKGMGNIYLKFKFKALFIIKLGETPF